MVYDRQGSREILDVGIVDIQEMRDLEKNIKPLVSIVSLQFTVVNKVLHNISFSCILHLRNKSEGSDKVLRMAPTHREEDTIEAK